MLETVIVIILVLWILGFLGAVTVPVLSGGLIHLLLVVALVILIIRLLRGACLTG